MQRACRDAEAVHDENDKADGSPGGPCSSGALEKEVMKKGRRKQSDRSQVTHTADSLHKLYHKPPETVYKRYWCGVVRLGNKVTVADCTPAGKCGMCARMKTVAAAHSPGKAAQIAWRSKLSEIFDRHTHAYNAASLYMGMGHDVTMYSLLKYPQGRVLAYRMALQGTRWSCATTLPTWRRSMWSQMR